MSLTTDKYEIDILNVNDADAIIIRCILNGYQYIILIDAGNTSDYATIKNHLKDVYNNTYIDLAICTHPDKDHIGGFFDLLEDKEITFNDFWLIDPAEYLDDTDIKYYGKDNAPKAVRKVFNKPNDSKQNLIDILKSKKVEYTSVYAGYEHPVIPIKVLAPTKKYYGEIVKNMVADYGVKTYDESDTEKYDNVALPDKSAVKSVIDLDDDPSSFNAGSIVLLFAPGDGKNFLFTGDANCASLYKMVQTYENELQNITLLKVPHHGSKHNMTTEIIDGISPKLSIISAVGTKKHPNSGIVYWLSKKGNVYSTHTNGSLHYRNNVDKRDGYSTANPLKEKEKK